MDLKRVIRDIPDFPSEGIIFRDITPVLQQPEAFSYAIDQLAKIAKEIDFDVLVPVESRGFIFGAPLAQLFNKPLAIARKPGKLPANVYSRTYNLEYGSATLEIHKDSISDGQKCLIIDDLLATGGTVSAAASLCQEAGGVVAGCLFVIELADLPGSKVLSDYEIFSLVKYGNGI